MGAMNFGNIDETNSTRAQLLTNTGRSLILASSTVFRENNISQNKIQVTESKKVQCQNSNIYITIVTLCDMCMKKHSWLCVINSLNYIRNMQVCAPVPVFYLLSWI